MEYHYLNHNELIKRLRTLTFDGLTIDFERYRLGDCLRDLQEAQLRTKSGQK